MAAPSVISEASAPGKLILFGEHAVVYGVTAIAGALSDLRIPVQIEVSGTGAVEVRTPAPDAEEGYEPSARMGRWELEELRAALGPAFAAHAAACEAAPSQPPRALSPTPDTTAALLPLCAGGPPSATKALAPALFLAAAIFARQLFRPAPAPGGRLPGLTIRVGVPTLPVAAGLGSSAAFSVAIAAALLDAWCRFSAPAGASDGLLGYGEPDAATPHGFLEADAGPAAPAAPLAPGAWHSLFSQAASELVNGWAFAAETLFHGAPSGLDNTVSTYGGALSYKRGAPAGGDGGPGPSFSPVHGLPPLRLLVVNTRVPKETSALVAGVRELHSALPAIVSPLLAAVGALVEEALAAFRVEPHRMAELLARGAVATARGGAAGHSGAAAAGEESGFGATAPVPEVTPALFSLLQRLVRANQGILAALGVGHPALDTVIGAAWRQGLAAKLTGAGGGGCGFVLLPPHALPSPGCVGSDGAPTVDATAAAVAANEAVAGKVRALIGELGASGAGFDCFETRVGGPGVLVRSPLA